MNTGTRQESAYSPYGINTWRSPADGTEGWHRNGHNCRQWNEHQHWSTDGSVYFNGVPIKLNVEATQPMYPDLSPKVGQPSNADLEKLLQRLDQRFDAAEANGRYRRERAVQRGHDNPALFAKLDVILTRLETLEAALGIAASKGGKRFDHIELLLAMMFTEINRLHRWPEPKKKGRRKR